jgi:type II secretory pathway pseudopilin PulG
MLNDKGYTLIEVMVVALVATMIGGALIQVLNSSGRASRLADLDSQAQQNARVAIDVVARDLRSIGYDLDVAQGQRSIAYAGPYDLVFNANIEPEPDDPNNPASPSAISVASSPATVPGGGTALYAPAVTFGTGAETIRFTFDSDGDGAVTSNDRSDEGIETATQNPHDYALGREVYGFTGTSNGGQNQAFALLRGPDAYPNGDLPYPLFTYWYDNDDVAATDDVLWGDASGNGELEQGEIASLGTVSATNLTRINRISIHVIGISRAPDLRYPDNEGYRESAMTSDVSVRNTPLKSAYIRGVVFDDVNANGVRDGGESGLAGAIVRLNTGQTRTTGADGVYGFRVDGAPYTVTETDPVGYTSTTANSVMLTAEKGAVVAADFGDQAIGGYGSILGRVIIDENGDGVLDPAEPGAGGVEIFLHTDERTSTDDETGAYMFTVPVASYGITMVVPSGYLAVGPVTYTRTLDAEGDTAVVNFGLTVHSGTGELSGTVYLDENENGQRDLGESGIAGVSVTLDPGDSTVTNGEGGYSFSTLAGTYDVTELDLGGYESTTLNTVTGVRVAPDSTSVVDFGDILASTLSFQVITLGETQRALCIASADLKEKEQGDARYDPEIILGTKYMTGVSNLNVWKNEWDPGDPNSAIFAQSPWYSRSPSEDIYATCAGDLSGDGVNDVLTGMTSTTGKTLFWRTQTNGNNAGILPTSATGYFVAQGPPDVLSMLVRDVDDDSDLDALIGTEYFTDSGRLEVWFNNGSGTFTHDYTSDVYASAGGISLGAVRAVAVGDVAGSAAPDIVLGTATGIYTGRIEIFRDNGSANGEYAYYKTIDATGEVSAVAVCDMLEDSYGDEDIIVGTKTGLGTGSLELWLNNGGGVFGEYDSLSAQYVPSDTAFFNAEVLCLAIDKFNRDIYPDVAVGLKNAGSYVGEIQVFQCYGYMPSGASWSSSSVGSVGEVITVTVNDFNKDLRQDFAIGTRTSSSRGTVVVFFNTTQ